MKIAELISGYEKFKDTKFKKYENKFLDLVNYSYIKSVSEVGKNNGYLGNVFLSFKNRKMNYISIYDLSDFIYKFNFPEKTEDRFSKLEEVNKYFKEKVNDKALSIIILLYRMMFVDRFSDFDGFEGLSTFLLYEL